MARQRCHQESTDSQRSDPRMCGGNHKHEFSLFGGQAGEAGRIEEDV